MIMKDRQYYYTVTAYTPMAREITDTNDLDFAMATASYFFSQDVPFEVINNYTGVILAYDNESDSWLDSEMWQYVNLFK